MTFRRFIKTPKGILLAILLPLAMVAALGPGIARVLPGLVAAVGTAILIDAPILRLRHPRWVFPDGAILTALIIAMVLTPQQPWYVAAATTAIAVISKYLVRIGKANVFNPAALGLVATYYLFDTGQSWWGALPEVTPFALIVLVAAGLFIAARVNKLPAMLLFLGVYYLLFTLSAFLGDPARVAELFIAPDLHAALFFAFFMVTDPPTSPPKGRDQLLFGAIVAAASFAFFQLVDAAYFMLAGLLVANAWEAARRWRMRAHRHAGRSAG